MFPKLYYLHILLGSSKIANSMWGTLEDVLLDGNRHVVFGFTCTINLGKCKTVKVSNRAGSRTLGSCAYLLPEGPQEYRERRRCEQRNIVDIFGRKLRNGPVSAA